jgi:hypothetical protein
VRDSPSQLSFLSVCRYFGSLKEAPGPANHSRGVAYSSDQIVSALNCPRASRATSLIALAF